MSEPTADPLIAPRIAALSAQLKAGKLTPEGRAKPYPISLSYVPDALLPFIESPSLPNLIEVLRKHPRLYWHPLVAQQVWHLVRLSWDQTEWHKLGWLIQYDEDGVPPPPKEAQEAHQELMRLIEAHGGGLVRRRIIWRKLRKKTGPKGRIKNPYPAMPWDEWIDPATLARDFGALHKFIKAKLASAGGWTDADKESYRNIILEALKESNIEWSSLAYEGPKTDAKPPTTGEEAIGFFTGEDFMEPWELAETVLGDTMRQKLNEADSLYQKAGVPASLAYAVLAALLKESPTKIKNAIDNYKYPREKKPAQPELTL
jgi:hypothetical protein